MQFATNEVIAAPIERVFVILSDFAALEAVAPKYNVEMKRLDSLTEAGVGLSWDIGFRLRGKAREVIVDVTRFEAPQFLEFSGVSKTFELKLKIALSALSAGQTRMKMVTEVTPRTLGARLIVQSAKLARGRITKRYERGVAQIAQEIAARAELA